MYVYAGGMLSCASANNVTATLHVCMYYWCLIFVLVGV
jgi:hypothetical protein